MEYGDKNYSRRKNRIKCIRTILEVIFIIIVSVIVVLSLYTFKSYKPYQERKNVPVTTDKGFVALSYFGVARTGTPILISEERLREHLQAMKDSGYETITQQDIIDYYRDGKKLPEKALFLAFEDGRRDTAIYAQKIIEDLNYKATAFTYPEKFELKDTKFLMPIELKDLENTTFWEMGTNGYRLAFINCFDRYNNYLGELTPLKHVMVAPYMGRKYNHYLMDYIRDEDYFPKESYNMMNDRISYDYEKLRDIYREQIGYVPGCYVLMHSNTGRFGNNDEVSSVNEKWITTLFNMNFNREGYCLNNRESSIYDLTRMQPQSYWYTNHLLMRVYHDQFLPVKFVRTNLEEAEKWTIKKGEPEFKQEKIILTTEPNSNALLFVKNARSVGDVHVTATLTGNKWGTQSIHLRANENLTNSISVSLSGNFLYAKDGGKELAKIDLGELDGKKKISVEEDKKAAEEAALLTFARYATTKEQGEIYAQRLRMRSEKPAKSVEEGAAEYIPDINVREPNKRDVEIWLKDNKMRIKVDGKDIDHEITVDNNLHGKIAIEAAFQGIGWSQRNLMDDVYDGVFEKLMVYKYDHDIKTSYWIDTELGGFKLRIASPFQEEEKVIYDSRLHGVAAVRKFVSDCWEALLKFFVEYF